METTHETVADTAKRVRVALKRSFPGVKFWVRSDSYAGGASIRVRWTDGPRVRDVEAVAKEFEGATFDSSQDLKSYVKAPVVGADGTPGMIHFGADYVFCDRDASPARRAAALAFLVERFGGNVATLPNFWTDTAIHRVCCDLGPAGELVEDRGALYVEEGWGYVR